jgi:hypothetical protein
MTDRYEEVRIPASKGRGGGDAGTWLYVVGVRRSSLDATLTSKNPSVTGAKEPE